MTACPVVVLTGSTSYEIGREVLRRGAMDFLSKDDLTPQNFVRAMENAVERWSLMRTLEEGRHEVKRLANAVPALISFIDKTFRFTQLNQHYEHWFGRSVKDLQGRHVREVLGEAAWEIAKPYMERALEGETVCYEAFLPYTSIEPRWVQVTYTPDIDRQSGRARGIIAHVINISARKQMEIELREQDKRKDEFLATLAHELRNPLAPLRNGIEILRIRPELCEELCGMMRRQLDQLVRLVDDLLDLARISRGQITLQLETVSVDEVVALAVEACRPMMSEKNHGLQLVGTNEAHAVEGDRIRLVQIVANLLANAVKYTPEKGHIEVANRRVGNMVEITVTDTGVGMDPAVVPSIWNMFTQVRDTLDKAQGGLGIGLSLVKRLVEMHGGSVFAESAGIGCGSRFTVRLPLAMMLSTVSEQVTVGAEPQKDLRRLRILVVDDNVDGAQSLATMLEFMGHETQTAYDGLEAVTLAEQLRPNIIIMDIGMPKLNGLEACRHIREQSWGKNICMVAQTGWGREDDQTRSREAGFDKHITKPADMSEIESILCFPEKVARPA